MEPTTASPPRDEPRDATAAALDRFCSDSGVAFCSLVDESGAVISSASPRGLAPRNMPEIGAIAAGAFGAASLLCQKLGECGQNGFHQPGKHWHSLLHPITGDAFLLCVFGGDVPVGLVRVAVGRARQEISNVLASGRERPFWP